MYYGQVYMDAVYNAYNTLYWKKEWVDDFETALNKEGKTYYYRDGDYDYYDLSNFIKNYGLDEGAIKKEVESKGHEYKG